LAEFIFPLHGLYTEDGRWDYRVTIVFVKPQSRTSPSAKTLWKKQLFPDQDTFTKEE